MGCATRNRTVPFCSTFAAFFTRAFDQIRMAAISESNINLCGSHCGVSIGERGPGPGRLLPVTSLDLLELGGGGVRPGTRCTDGVLIQPILSHTPGEDGPSQMALEDLAMFRSVPMSTVFYPSDGVATEKAVELAANTKVGHRAVLSAPAASPSIEDWEGRPACRPRACPLLHQNGVP